MTAVRSTIEYFLDDLAALSSLLLTEDLQASLQRVAELGVEHVAGCDQIGVTLVREDRVETGIYLGGAVCEIDGAQYDTGRGPCLDAIRDRRTQQVDDMATDTRWPSFAATAQKRGIWSSLSLPLVAYEEALGALNLYSGTPQGFDEDGVRSGLLLAKQAAIALANARAYDTLKSAVVTLQRSLLPQRLPAVQGFTLAARYRPAGAQALVGGDWYDAAPASHGGIALTIGDVAGHGLPAAATMGRLRTALRAYAREGHGPAPALNLLAELFDDLRPEEFATVCQVDLTPLSPETVTLRAATAGHPGPLVLAPDGSVRFVEPEAGPPVGVLTSGALVEQDLVLQRGSVVVLFTDGLVERRGRSLDDGLAELAKAVAAGPSDLEALCDHVLATVFNNREPDDDVAMLAARADADPTSP